MDPQPTVYLVEDNAELRESLKWLLQSQGYRVVASASPSDMLERYDPAVPGCLVLDIQLPEMSGIELYERLRRRGGAHPFIVITAYGRVPLAVEAMRLGAVDFVEKPFTHTQILERVAEAVARDLKNREAGEYTRLLRTRLAVLTPRQWEVAELVAEGASTKEIASRLRIKFRTAEKHRQNILHKLNVESSAQVATLITQAKALKKLGLIDFPK